MMAALLVDQTTNDPKFKGSNLVTATATWRKLQKERQKSVGY